MKLSVNEAKLNGLWARNCATIQQVLISYFAFGPEKLPTLSRHGPLERASDWIKQIPNQSETPHRSG